MSSFIDAYILNQDRESIENQNIYTDAPIVKRNGKQIN